MVNVGKKTHVTYQVGKQLTRALLRIVERIQKEQGREKIFYDTDNISYERILSPFGINEIIEYEKKFLGIPRKKTLLFSIENNFSTSKKTICNVYDSRILGIVEEELKKFAKEIGLDLIIETHVAVN